MDDMLRIMLARVFGGIVMVTLAIGALTAGWFFYTGLPGW